MGALATRVAVSIAICTATVAGSGGRASADARFGWSTDCDPTAPRELLHVAVIDEIPGEPLPPREGTATLRCVLAEHEVRVVSRHAVDAEPITILGWDGSCTAPVRDAVTVAVWTSMGAAASGGPSGAGVYRALSYDPSSCAQHFSRMTIVVEDAAVEVPEPPLRSAVTPTVTALLPGASSTSEIRVGGRSLFVVEDGAGAEWLIDGDRGEILAITGLPAALGPAYLAWQDGIDGRLREEGSFPSLAILAVWCGSLFAALVVLLVAAGPTGGRRPPRAIVAASAIALASGAWHVVLGLAAAALAVLVLTRERGGGLFAVDLSGLAWLAFPLAVISLASGAASVSTAWSSVRSDELPRGRAAIAALLALGISVAVVAATQTVVAGVVVALHVGALSYVASRR